MTTITSQGQQTEGVRTAEQAIARSDTSHLGRVAWAALAAAAVSLPFVLGGGWLIYQDYAEQRDARAARAERMKSHERLFAGAPRDVLPVDRALHGREIFTITCAACHGVEGTGVMGLGKDLTTSWFVASLGDDELHRFISYGRSPLDPENTTRILMPAKGGHPELTDADLKDVVAYVRGLQDPRRMPPLPTLAALAAAPPTDDEKAKALAAAGGDAELAGYIAHGTKLFAGTCAACHGKDGRGLKGLGKDIVTSEFARKLDDDGLLAFVKRGRNPGDPLNTTKIDMPSKGGNPALSDDDILDIISYVRSLQKQADARP